MNEIIYGLGKLFQESFKILNLLGNIPNYIFIATGFILLFYWLKEMVKYNREAEEKGTLK
ncbi:MAG: uracil phosphoribosyltransferase [Bacteroidetes bacterium]|nr:uracil phosphoribosyltransferase [Bacteroidota bacterium]HET6245428.1 uracil phosphoribosyltransferase [Bacteroidia bacterium]